MEYSTANFITSDRGMETRKNILQRVAIERRNERFLQGLMGNMNVSNRNSGNVYKSFVLVVTPRFNYLHSFTKQNQYIFKSIL